MLNRKFPLTRLRRLRSNSFIRDIVDENKITTDDLIQPIFVKDSDGIEEIDKMPNVFRYGLDVLIKEVREICELGIKSIAIFPVIDSSKRDEAGSEAFNENNLACSAIKLIKEHYPDLIIISDVALDPYTNHGHDGVLIDGYVDNDSTVSALVKQALCLANAGADIIAPSDMMDGRVKFIREALEESNFKNTIILSYAAKYSSSFYGPFREAVKSSSKLGNSSKSSYQMSSANSDEAIHEVAMDINEGADMVMVKPGMPYLDIISKVKEVFQIPTFAYQVSGEYSMLKHAIENGLLDKKVMLESILCFKRAGADAFLHMQQKKFPRS